MIDLKTHEKYLILAQQKSQKSYGFNFPNPSVGCVIVDYFNNKGGKVISYGSTGIDGRPHAEEIALKNIKRNYKKLIMYVTLEPCFHVSRNLSCVDQIIKFGIENIYIATKDPDFRTNSKSIKKLKKNNIKVNVGLTKNLTYKINRFFYINKKLNRSYVKFKMAVSKDFKIKNIKDNNKWISSFYSRKYSHNLRFQSDAILTTYSTVKSDNPKLTIRLKNYPKFKNKIIILDSNLEINTKSNLVNSSNKRNIIIFTMSKNKSKINKLKNLNCKIINIKGSRCGYFNMKSILKQTYKLGVCNILIEAGGKLFTDMFNKNIIDELHLFISSKKIGITGIPMYLTSNIFPLKKLNSSLITKKFIKNDLYYHFNL